MTNTLETSLLQKDNNLSLEELHAELAEAREVAEANLGLNGFADQLVVDSLRREIDARTAEVVNDSNSPLGDQLTAAKDVANANLGVNGWEDRLVIDAIENEIADEGAGPTDK